MKPHLYIIAVFLSLFTCTNKSKYQEANNLNIQAKEAINLKHYQKALTYSEDALSIYQSLSDTLGLANSYYFLARASALSSNFNNAVKYGVKGSEICKNILNFEVENRINNTLSWAYFELGKGFDETFDHQQRQLFVVEQLDDDTAKASVYNNYGYDGTVSGKISLDKAMHYSKIANDHYAKSENNNGRWYTLMNLTWQHRLINDLVESEKFGRLSVAQAEADSDRHAIIEANTNLGETLLLQNKIDEAKPLYERGLELNSQLKDRDKFVFDLYHAHYMWLTGEKDKSIGTLKAAIEFLEGSEIFYEMMARAFLAKFSFERNDLVEAKNQIAIFKKPRANYFSEEARMMVALVESQIIAMNNTKEAIDFLKLKNSELNSSGAHLLKSNISKLIAHLENDKN